MSKTSAKIKNSETNPPAVAEMGSTLVSPEAEARNHVWEDLFKRIEVVVKRAMIGGAESAQDGENEIKAAAEDAGASPKQIAEWTRRAKESGKELVQKIKDTAVKLLKRKESAKARLASGAASGAGPKRTGEILGLSEERPVVSVPVVPEKAESAQVVAEVPAPEEIQKVTMEAEPAAGGAIKEEPLTATGAFRVAQEGGIISEEVVQKAESAFKERRAQRRADAEAVLDAVASGGVPAFVSKSLEKVLRAYGFSPQEIAKTKPDDLIAALKGRVAADKGLGIALETGGGEVGVKEAPEAAKQAVAEAMVGPRGQEEGVVELPPAKTLEEQADEAARRLLSEIDTGLAYEPGRAEEILRAYGFRDTELQGKSPNELYAMIREKLASRPEARPETPEERAEREKYEALEKNLGEARAKYAKLSREFKKLGEDKEAAETARAEKSKEVETAKNEYLEARKQGFEYKLGFFEKEVDGKIKAGQLAAAEKEAELKKFATFGLVDEFKQLYDTKTEQEIAEKKKSISSRIGKTLYNTFDWYRKLPLQRKLEVSGILIALGGGVGASAVVAGAVAAGVWTMRIAGGGATTIALEAFLKKKHEKKIAKEIGEVLGVGKEIEDALKKTKEGKTAEGLVGFLKTGDEQLLKKFEDNEKEFKKTENRLRYRRWAFAGGIGVLIGSGATSWVVRELADKVGFHPIDSLFGKHAPNAPAPKGGTKAAVEAAAAKHAAPGGKGVTAGIIEKGVEKTPPIQELPMTKPMPKEVFASYLEAMAKESHNVATIDKGGNIWKAAHSLVENKIITVEQFRHAWTHSTVEIRGVKVPISDVGLSHAHDQVVYVPDAHGGHFDVVDYAKDKFSLGTNKDLLNIFQNKHAPVPKWLMDAVGHHTGTGHPAGVVMPAEVAAPHAEVPSAPETVMTQHPATEAAVPAPEAPHGAAETITPPPHEAVPQTSGAEEAQPQEAAPPVGAEAIPQGGTSEAMWAEMEEAGRYFSVHHNPHEELAKLNSQFGALTSESKPFKYFAENVSADIGKEFSHTNLFEQQQIIDEARNYLEKSTNPVLKNWYKWFLNHLTKDEFYAKSLENFQKILGKAKITGNEYDAVKNMKVGKFLEHHALRGVKDWFVSPRQVLDYGYSGGTVPELTPTGTFHEGVLADEIRRLMGTAPSPADECKKWTIDKFLKVMSQPFSE